MPFSTYDAGVALRQLNLLPRSNLIPILLDGFGAVKYHEAWTLKT